MTPIMRLYALPLLKTASIISVLLTIVIWLTQSLRFMPLIVLQGLSFADFVLLIGWILPDLLCLAMPFAFFVAVLLIYTRALADHEITALKAAGCSTFYLLRPIWVIGAWGVGFLYLISLYVVPLSFQVFRQQESILRASFSRAMIQEGEFNSFGSVVLHTQRMNPDGSLEGLLVYDARNPLEASTIMAQKAYVTEHQHGLKIVLRHGSRQTLGTSSDPDAQGTPGEATPKAPTLLQFEQYVLSLMPDIPQTRHRKPYEMSLSELFARHQGFSSRDQGRLYTEGYQRLLSPFYLLAFGLVAGGLLLRAPSTRLGRQKTWIFAFCVMLAIQIGSFLALQTEELPPPIRLGIASLLIFSPLLCLGVAKGLHMRQHRRALWVPEGRHKGKT